MKLKIGVLVTMLSLMLVGCTNEDTKKPEENISSGNETQENIGTEKEEKEEQEQEDHEEVQSEVEEKDENKGQINTNSEEEKTEAFKIYTLDVNDTDKKIEFKAVELKKDSSVEDKLKELCSVLEKEYFKDANANIVFKSIDENNIATIDLVNKDAWHQHFQGSTGGMVSQSTIVETLLQRDYAGEWIDGLNVVVDGTSGEELFEHAPFIEIFYRKK